MSEIKSDLQVTTLKQSRANSDSSEVWRRLSGFLSLKAPSTQKTYLGVLEEWLEFLGAKSGTESGASAMLSADELHAIAFVNLVRSKQGQRPRFQRSSSNASLVPSRSRGRVNVVTDGLQSTAANATVRKKIAALRRLYRVLVASPLPLVSNPFAGDNLTAPSALSGQKRPTEMIPFSKVSEMLELPDKSTPSGIRDKALLAVLFGGGLRRGELVKLCLGDVQKTPAGTLFLKLRSTKAKRDANQALAPWASKAVEALIALRFAEGAKPGDPVFVGFRGPKSKRSNGKALSDSGVYRIFRSYCQKAELDIYLSPHSARATSITRLLDQGLSHRQVQEFSRHASVQMVEVYDKRRFGVDENPAKDLEF